jgi:hypothetical protein
VIGFCTEEEHDRFLEFCPQVEKFMVGGARDAYGEQLEPEGGRRQS